MPEKATDPIQPAAVGMTLCGEALNRLFADLGQKTAMVYELQVQVERVTAENATLKSMQQQSPAVKNRTAARTEDPS